MFNFLTKSLLKNKPDIDTLEGRGKYGILAAFVGIFSNILLFIGKIVIGILSGAISIIADAINNLSDAGSSVVTLIGFKLSIRPADKEHPYGHARYEYITGLFVAIIILIIGILLGKSSIEKIITPQTVQYNWITYTILGVSIFVKLFQMRYYLYISKIISSDTLKNTSIDSRNDIISTICVLIAAIITALSGYNIDGYIGIAVSLFIIISSVCLIKETINPLIGEMPDPNLVKKILEKLKEYDEVLGYHDLMIHNYGPMRVYASMHIELPSSKCLLDSHDLIDNIERDYMKDMNVHLVLHLDPIEVDDVETNELKSKITTILTELKGFKSIHDFRLVKGATHTNVLFDALVDNNSQITAGIIETLLRKKIVSDRVYYYIITIDTSFID